MKLTKARKYGHIVYHVCGFRATFCRETCSIDTKIIQYRAANISKYVQGWAKEWSRLLTPPGRGARVHAT